MKTGGENSYEEICERWRKEFLTMDQEELLARRLELKREGERITLRHYHRKFGVCRSSGEIEALEDGGHVTCYEKMNIYALLRALSAGARLQGEWVPFEKLRGTAPFYRSFQANIVRPFAKMFQGRLSELERACVGLEGKKLPWSDAGYELKAFDCIPVRFLFWEGDDEFPAQGNLLFDVSAADFIDEKSLIRVALVGLGRIAKQAGVPMDASAFLIF